MTEHGRKSLGLEHIILHHIASKTDSKDGNENTQITTQKSVTQNVTMVKKGIQNWVCFGGWFV